MDFPGGLRGLLAVADGPGAHFLLAAGDEGDQAQRFVAHLHQLIQAALSDAQIGQKFAGLVFRHLGQFALDLRADLDHRSSLGGSVLAHLTHEIVVGGQIILAHVCHVDHGLDGDQTEFFGNGGIIATCAGGFALAQHGQNGLGQFGVFARFLVAALALFLEVAQAFFQPRQVRQNQFGVDGLDVVQRVHGARHMHHVVVGEAAHHMGNRVGLADVGQKLVAQALARTGPLDQPRDIHELHESGNDRRHAVPLGKDPAQGTQALVRHHDAAHVRLDGGKGVIGRQRPGARDGVKQRAFSDVRQSDNSNR
ncbi:hypothetical protein DEMA109039_17420 [Deinococcus marmoris]